MSALPAIPPPQSSHSPGGSPQDRTGTTTRPALSPGEHTSTRTVMAPGFSTALEVENVRGLRLDQILLGAASLLVLVIIALLGVVQAVTTARQFDEVSAGHSERIQNRARELGLTLSHTLSLTSASALRDSNYAFLAEVAREIIEKNPNVLRVQVADPEGLVVADSDPHAQPGEELDRALERASRVGTFEGKPVYEYQEPIDYGASAGKGLVVLYYSLEALQSELRELEGTKQGAVRTVVIRTAGLGLGFLLLAGVLAAYFSRRITRPLLALTAGAKELAQGNLETRVSATGSSREVGTLGAVFNHMAERMSFLMEDARVKAALERDMLLARQVQEALLPGREPLRSGPLQLAGVVVAADATGGDWWLRAELGPHKVVLGVGDATGHGLAAAMVACSASAGFAAALRTRAPEEVTAAGLLTSLNQTLHLIGRGEQQMSSALAVFDLQKNEVEYASGGHPSALVVNRQSGEVGSLLSRGSLLGASEHSLYTSRTAPLRPGDILVWYTDGLTESENTSRQAYGTQRLLACVRQNLTLSAERLRDAILLDVRQHSGTQPQNDDITVVVAEFSPQPTQAA